MSVDLMQPPSDEAVTRASSRFAEVALDRYGAALRGVYLFGSRARGDYAPFSDVDLAIVVDDAVDTSRETFPLSGYAYDILVETGAEVQPWVFHRAEWERPEQSASPALVRSIKNDARAVSVQAFAGSAGG